MQTKRFIPLQNGGWWFWAVALNKWMLGWVESSDSPPDYSLQSDWHEACTLWSSYSVSKTITWGGRQPRLESARYLQRVLMCDWAKVLCFVTHSLIFIFNFFWHVWHPVICHLTYMWQDRNFLSKNAPLWVINGDFCSFFYVQSESQYRASELIQCHQSPVQSYLVKSLRCWLCLTFYSQMSFNSLLCYLRKWTHVSRKWLCLPRGPRPICFWPWRTMSKHTSLSWGSKNK